MGIIQVDSVLAETLREIVDRFDASDFSEEPIEIQLPDSFLSGLLESEAVYGVEQLSQSIQRVPRSGSP